MAVRRDAEYGARTTLDVGLLDWCEPERPTSDSIAGATVIDYGTAHVKTIRETGGELLGHRPLDADGGSAALLGQRTYVLPAATWGYATIEALAHEHFGRHFPAEPAVATSRPAPLLARWDQRD